MGDGSFSILAQTSSEKAKIFNEQFYANTLIPTDFPDNSVHLDSIKSFLMPHLNLGNYSFCDKGGFKCNNDVGNRSISDSQFSHIVHCSQTTDSLFPFVFDLSMILNPCDSLFSRQEIFFTRRRLKKGVGSALCNNDHVRKLTLSKQCQYFNVHV